MHQLSWILRFTQKGHLSLLSLLIWWAWIHHSLPGSVDIHDCHLTSDSHIQCILPQLRNMSLHKFGHLNLLLDKWCIWETLSLSFQEWNGYLNWSGYCHFVLKVSNVCTWLLCICHFSFSCLNYVFLFNYIDLSTWYLPELQPYKKYFKIAHQRSSVTLKNMTSDNVFPYFCLGFN